MLTRPSLISSTKRLLAPPRQSQVGARRWRSNSPYGRTHIPPKFTLPLPPPVVALYPQTVISSDGSSFTHWSTSPQSTYKMARDIHNNALYWPGETYVRAGEEDEQGRMGRFKRRFARVGQAEEGVELQGELFREGAMGWLDEMSEEWGEKESERNKKMTGRLSK